MNKEYLPVLSYKPTNGFEVLGHAKSIDSAKKIIMRNLCDQSLSLINKHKFKLSVMRRTALMIELNGGPDGFIFSIAK